MCGIWVDGRQIICQSQMFTYCSHISAYTQRNQHNSECNVTVNLVATLCYSRGIHFLKAGHAFFFFFFFYMITKAVKGDFSPNVPGVLDRFQTRMIVLVVVVSASLLLPELQVWFSSQANAPND